MQRKTKEERRDKKRVMWTGNFGREGGESSTFSHSAQHPSSTENVVLMVHGDECQSDGYSKDSHTIYIIIVVGKEYGSVIKLEHSPALAKVPPPCCKAATSLLLFSLTYFYDYSSLFSFSFFVCFLWLVLDSIHLCENLKPLPFH